MSTVVCNEPYSHYPRLTKCKKKSCMGLPGTSELQLALASEDWITILNTATSQDDFLTETQTSFGRAKLLHFCAYANNIRGLSILLRRRGVNPDITVKEFVRRRMVMRVRTPLHFAAAAGHVSAINALLDAGADIDGDPVLGESASESPLHTAAAFGHEAAVDTLLNRGAFLER